MFRKHFSEQCQHRQQGNVQTFIYDNKISKKTLTARFYLSFKVLKRKMSSLSVLKYNSSTCMYSFFCQIWRPIWNIKEVKMFQIWTFWKYWSCKLSTKTQKKYPVCPVCFITSIVTFLIRFCAPYTPHLRPLKELMIRVQKEQGCLLLLKIEAVTYPSRNNLFLINSDILISVYVLSQVIDLYLSDLAPHIRPIKS